MRLGIVTYQIAANLDLTSLLELCQQTRVEGLELRTTHTHGVEPSLKRAERAAVKEQISESGLVLWGLGSTCEYDHPDPEIVRQNIEQTLEFIDLAAALGARGVKVRPNHLHEQEGVPVAETLKQIGLALRECGPAADNAGVEIWLEVHGAGTSLPRHIATIMRHCNHPSVGVCWNSNPTDVENGSIAENFKRLQPWIRSVHITELWRSDYPWRELFALLARMDYRGFTLAEIPASPEPERLLHYYRALWQELTGS